MTNTGTIIFQTTIQTIYCCDCGVLFGMPDRMLEKRREDGQNFFCPNGHKQHFTETEAAKLRKKLERTQLDHDWERTARTALEDQLAASERSRTALRGVITRQRNRVAAGVCPVDTCHRHFADLGRHMRGQHPGYTQDGDHA